MRSRSPQKIGEPPYESELEQVLRLDRRAPGSGRARLVAGNDTGGGASPLWVSIGGEQFVMRS
jgi:hypothetical protein